MAVAYIVVKRRIAIRWIFVAIAAVILIYPIAEFQRRVILRGNTQGAVYALQRPVEMISRISRFVGSQEFGDYLMQGVQATSRRSDGLGILSVIVRDCPSRVPYQGGWTLGYIVLSYVPRIVWADKPDMTTGLWVTENFGRRPRHRLAHGPDLDRRALLQLRLARNRDRHAPRWGSTCGRCTKCSSSRTRRCQPR